nr:DUF4105 domain-containing protein [Stenotrophomonas ginsengisoli]
MAVWIRRIGKLLATLLLLVVAIWGAGVIHFHASGAVHGLGMLLWGGLSLALLWWFWRDPGRGLAWTGLAFLLALLGLSVFWNSLHPSQDRQWADDVARRLHVRSFDGRHVVLDNVRNFTWRSETDYDIVWEPRRYDLQQLQSADVLLSYWMGPTIAHTLVSFGFADGRQLVFSLEIRKEHDESFDALAGFFRRYEMTLVAADERDIVATRTNARGEDVYLYRVSALQGQALRELFVAYLEQARALDRAPAFYNTLTSNCTTIVWQLARKVSPDLPLDWRLLASGYFDDYLQQQGALPQGVAPAALKQHGRITGRARADGASTHFSQRIRQGVPGIDQGAVDE